MSVVDDELLLLWPILELASTWVNTISIAGKSRYFLWTFWFEFYYVHPTLSVERDWLHQNTREKGHIGRCCCSIFVYNVRAENCNFAWFMWCSISTLITQSEWLEQKQDASIVGMLHGEFSDYISAKLTFWICPWDLQKENWKVFLWREDSFCT